MSFGDKQESTTHHDVREQIMTLKLESCKISDCAFDLTDYFSADDWKINNYFRKKREKLKIR